MTGTFRLRFGLVRISLISSDGRLGKLSTGSSNIQVNPCRVFWRLHFLEAWSTWEDRVGTHRRYASGSKLGILLRVRDVAVVVQHGRNWASCDALVDEELVWLIRRRGSSVSSHRMASSISCDGRPYSLANWLASVAGPESLRDLFCGDTGSHDDRPTENVRADPAK